MKARDEQAGISPERASKLRMLKRIPILWVETLVTILVLGLIVSAGVAGLTTRDRTISNEMVNLAQTSLMLAEHAHGVIFGADLLASSVEERILAAGVRSPEAFRRYGATKAMHDALQEGVILTSDTDALSLIGADGTFINTSRGWPPAKVNLSDRGYFTTMRDNPGTAHLITAPLKNRVTGQESIFLVHRISGPDGAFLGLITSTISTSRFEKLFASLLHHDNASISLYRRDGMLLSRQPQLAGGREESPEIQRFLQETMSRAEQGTLRTQTLAAPRLVAMHTVRGYPLMISATNSEAMVLAEWRKLALLIFLFTSAAIILLILLGLAFIRQSKMQAQVAETAEGLAHVNEELAAANRELDAFSYSVAHDLRSPLRTIAGFSSIVLEENRDKISEASAQHLGRIRAGATHMGQIIDDLLQLSRIARSEVDWRDFDLSELALGVVRTLSEAHLERGVQVIVQPGIRANGDPNLVRGVLENLLGNAWKFTARTGNACIEVGCNERDGEVIYFVRDNGAGFDMRYSDKLFKPFQRLHGTDEFEGTGIGLSIVQRIVTRHGGKIWAESEVGKGAVFSFTLGTAPRSGLKVKDTGR